MQPTDDQIRQLEIEAGAAGDHEMVVTCRRARCGDPDAVTEVANVICEASGNYSIAFVNESDGSFDVVFSFAADSDDDANDFAERNYDGQEWFVLDQHGRNING